jgi:hypothetical protein
MRLFHRSPQHDNPSLPHKFRMPSGTQGMTPLASGLGARGGIGQAGQIAMTMAAVRDGNGERKCAMAGCGKPIDHDIHGVQE